MKKFCNFAVLYLFCFALIVSSGCGVPEPTPAKPDLPLTITYREARIGWGMVAIIKNNSDSNLTVGFETTWSTGEPLLYNLFLPAKQSKEYGWMELGGQLTPGGTFTLSHPAYKTKTYYIGAPTR